MTVLRAKADRILAERKLFRLEMRPRHGAVEYVAELRPVGCPPELRSRCPIVELPSYRRVPIIVIAILARGRP